MGKWETDRATFALLSGSTRKPTIGSDLLANTNGAKEKLIGFLGLKENLRLPS